MADSAALLFSCRSRGHLTEKALTAIESGLPLSQSSVYYDAEVLQHLNRKLPKQTWVELDDFGDAAYRAICANPTPISRPPLPGVKHPFIMPCHIWLFFSETYVAAVHHNRWWEVVENPGWLAGLIEMARDLAQILDADQAFYTADMSEAILSIEETDLLSFDELMSIFVPAPRMKGDEHYGEIRPIENLYKSLDELDPAMSYWEFWPPKS